MRRHTRLIPILAALLVFAAMLVAAPAALAQDGGNYVGPEVCKACHPAQVEAWNGAPHADASKVAAFVEAWQAAKSPGYCLACHTTGYDSNTGQYAFEGVSCEACHGKFDSGHPKTPMVVDASPQACGHCHQSTLTEWEFSQHGQQNIGCVTCHDVHGGTIKTGQATELCGKCHAEIAANFSHASSAGKGLACADCHVGPRSGDPTEGHANTGHTFLVGMDACSRCHAEEIHRGVQAMMGDSQPAPTPSPTAMAATTGTPPRTAGLALPMVGSAAFGLGLGVVWARWRKRRARSVEGGA